MAIFAFALFFESLASAAWTDDIPLPSEISLEISLPAEILLSIESIEADLPDEASFEISSEASSEAFLEVSLPVPTPTPSLPAMPTFGTPKPPDTPQALATMPDMVFWKDPSPPKKLGNLNKNASGSKVARNVPQNESAKSVSGSHTLDWPVWGMVSSGFGPRGAGPRKRMHRGIDILVPKGTPVLAAAAGVVAEAREYNGYGQTVILDHSDGTQTLYAHCSELAVRKGDKVERGQAIAYAGDTGRATAYHVHFGVMVSGTFQDPMTLLPKGPLQFVRRTEQKNRRKIEEKM
jgi:hypothetical protein